VRPSIQRGPRRAKRPTPRHQREWNLRCDREPIGRLGSSSVPRPKGDRMPDLTISIPEEHAGMDNISERIVQMLNEDDMDGIMHGLHKQPPRYLPTNFEGAMREWGLIFGLTFGAMRQEDPWESNYEVAMRALEPAQMAFRARGGFDRSDLAEREEAALSAVGEDR
jgi:hypothetical protein